MNEETQIVPAESLRLGALVVSPEDVISRATAIATALAAIIKSRKLYSTISGKNFTRCEGWTTMGAMLGLLPREDGVVRHEDGSFEATVSIIRTSDGAVVGRASAIVGMDESTWSKRPEYARRSMAVTRATGKAFRLGFSWIMTLAGYEPTPAEEIPDEPIEGHFSDAPALTMSIETAKAVKSKDGKLYGDFTLEELTEHFNGIQIALRKNKLSPEKREELQFKRDACAVLIAENATSGKEPE